MASPSILDSLSVLLVGTIDWVARFATMLKTRTDATVRRVRTESEALAAYRNQTTDCLICAYELDDATGLKLLREIRTETPHFR
jgi:CheY-like chemotaxis protein